MSDNPFSEPEDSDRTVVRPMPGGQRAARPAPAPRPPAVPAPAPPAPVPPGPDMAAIADAVATAHATPLAAAATPLIQLLARLRNTATPPDPGDIRERTVRELRVFERRARDTGVPMDQLRPAHYALCAALDDLVLNTPWGRTGRWSTGTLAATFHQEARSGERFFDQLRQLRRDPAAFLPVIELMYVCLSLGFLGPYRRSPSGQEEAEEVRREAYDAIVAQRRPAAAELSPRWVGVAAPYRPRRTRLPVWVAGSAALAAVAGLFVWCMTELNAGSDALHARMLAVPPATMPAIVRAALVRPPPPPPAPPEPSPADRLRDALRADIDGRRLAVLGSASAATVRIGAAGLFPAGSATLLPGAAPLLDRVGVALKAQPGPIRVAGYTDSQPSRTVRFPSNFQLSAARAEAVRAALARSLGEAGRMSSEGRAEADPVAPNTSAESREQNRRIDIVLQGPPP